MAVFLCGLLTGAGAEPLATLDEDSSYALGAVIGSQMEEMEIAFNEERFSDGFYAAMSGNSEISAEKALMLVTGALGGGPGETPDLNNETSYALGAAIAHQLINGGISLAFSRAQFVNGFMAERNGASVIPVDEAAEKLEGIITAASESKARENLEKSERFLAENAKKSGVKTTASGLQYVVAAKGSGKKPASQSVVTVNYEGRLVDGTVFDSSYERGEAAQFPLEDVISGWTEGIQLMSVGSKFTFYVPPKLGYGDMSGLPIPPNSVLIFDVELLAIE
ncbi:MAG: FKBP-type peptidyl-prolyl cis-trans isomerase [Spirochaetaceae bacterium]|nr:FKBP-type peptidyl-prolyl cis-trans isomerase [Spirochaetaceae bacterium]